MCNWSERNGKNGKNGMRSIKPLIHKHLPFSVFYSVFVPFSVPFGGVRVLYPSKGLVLGAKQTSKVMVLC